MSVILLVIFAGGQALSAAPAAPAPTLQQRFDVASTAAAEGRCDDALKAFAAIEATGAPRRNGLVAAAIDVRRGRCLVQTGHVEEGEAAIRRGLPALIAKGGEFTIDVREARLNLGGAATRRLDYAGAEREYRAALDGAVGATRIFPLMRLSNVLMFDHDGRALAAAEEARRIALETPDVDKKSLANVQTQYARVLLNDGRDREAYQVLRDSLAKQGGLDLRVGLAEVITRSDLAIAALRNKDTDGARNYLAYTGAGRMKDLPFARARDMDGPPCGGEAGLGLDDSAIVEFSLEEDGRVAAAAPIFATGNRAKALAFARAVLGWSWRPEDAKAIPAFFRYATRVEMRCIRAPEAPRLTAPLREAADTWVEQAGAPPPAWAEASAATALPMERAALAAASGRGDKAAALQAALALLDNDVLPDDDRAGLVARASEFAAALKAPISVRLGIALFSSAADKEERGRDTARQLLAREEFAADPLAAATLRMLIAAPLYRTQPPADADALAAAVVAEQGLPPRHPLKVAALLEQANLKAAKGDIVGARALFDRTGLDSQQCALVGLRPAMTRTGAGPGDYPFEAVRLGFQGWVRTEFDIAPDGRTVAPRAVIAYPPFVFDDAAIGIARDARFTSTFRPEGAIACSGYQVGVNFQLP